MTKWNRLLLDAGLFAGLALALFPTLTGLSIHEWLSLAIVLPALAHLVINWDWVLTVAARLFAKVRAGSKLNLVVDSALFVTTVTVMLSGLMVSRVISAAIGITASGGAIWSVTHSASAYATIALAITHLGLHWSWIAKVVRERVRRVPKEVLA